MKSKIMGIYNMSVIKRSVIIWITFQVILWVVFGITYLFHLDAWNKMTEVGVTSSNPNSLLLTILFIIGNNLILFLLIGLGNIFVRFGMITPGLFILFVQGVLIGTFAGSNSFDSPFRSLSEANFQFLKVGLWETTAYALICAVTLTKSLNIAEKFPAKQWSQVRKLKEIKFNMAEKTITIISVLLLVTAALIEAVYLTK